ncbi:YciI family protein [Nonomuraea sp. NPDC050394]|uniref:YciI family protein n=1 Tax=Nonomuraea sp. NPDC050394 TaxID=3364363 RepID=UPI00379E30E0
MKYLILIYSNPETRQVWDALPMEQRSAGLDAYAKLTRDLAASGELIANAALTQPSAARTVTVSQGEVVVSDGPFAEAKEYLAGIYLIECESEERAIETAARVPEAQVMRIEVRPVVELSDFL